LAGIGIEAKVIGQRDGSGPSVGEVLQGHQRISRAWVHIRAQKGAPGSSLETRERNFRFGKGIDGLGKPIEGVL
jgi:hypothetical protein